MMHDGNVIVEGTPEEIRANETVHDLYLGGRDGRRLTGRCSRSRAWTASTARRTCSRA